MNFMQKNYSDNQNICVGNNYNYTPQKSQMTRYGSQNSFSNYNNCGSTASSNYDYDNDNSFNYDSEDADTGMMVGQALQYCEATRGGQKKQFANADERYNFKQQYEMKKKTELCRNFEMYSSCKYGDTCSYAHGSHQLQKKTHLPSNFMTKMCTQFHRDGTCQYGERCQYLHSAYDLKTELTYTQALKEGARLTKQRNDQIGNDSYAECLWANLKTGDGCGAPKKPRLACFEQIYNKESLYENLRKIQEEDATTKVAAVSTSPAQAPAPKAPAAMNNCFNNNFQQTQYQQPMMMKYNSYNQNMSMNMVNFGYQMPQQPQVQQYQNFMQYNQCHQMNLQQVPTFSKRTSFVPQQTEVSTKFESFFRKQSTSA